MINDLVNNKYYCFLDPSCRQGEYELLVAKSIGYNYYPMYYDSGSKDFVLDGTRWIKKSWIYSSIVGTDTGFHKYSRNEKYKDGYYLVSFSGSCYVKVVKIMNNIIYDVVLKNGTLVTYPLDFLGVRYISYSLFYRIQKSVEKI